MVKQTKAKSKPTKKSLRAKTQPPKPERHVPFMTHVRELRRRLLFVGLSVVVGGTLAYTINEQLTRLLLAPAGSQQFIYTTPGGGFDFLLRLCLYGGVLVSIPVLTYQILRFLQPLITRDALRFVRWGSVTSALLAACGFAFGYFIGLPAAMHFLLQGFSHNQIVSLITIQSYLSFILIYLVGCALLFQIPLILVLINHIKPLKPKRLFLGQRWFVIGALVVGAIINPSPNIQDQLLLSVPMIVMYQLSIVLIWFINRRRNANTVASQSAYELQ